MTEWLEDTWPWRVALGALFFLVLGVLDLVRHPEDPRRAREYGFLLFAMVLGVVYGVLHDQVTCTISSEYFRIGKELADDPRPFRWAVTVLAAKASYGPGLLVGAALLIANNPSPARPSLGYRELARLALLPLGGAVLAAALGGVLYPVLGIEADYAAKLVGKAAAPRFLVTWGIHTGSYAGGALGAIAAVVAVRRRRARARSDAVTHPAWPGSARAGRPGGPAGSRPRSP